MTLIALTCQNRIEVTQHAGQCRKFMIFPVEGNSIGEPKLLELPAGQSLHDSGGNQPHALDGVDWLISGSMGDGLRRRLAARGIRTLQTTERNPHRAVQRFVAGELPDEGVPHDHEHDHEPHHAHQHAHGHGHAGGGCGGCGCHHKAPEKAPVTS